MRILFFILLTLTATSQEKTKKETTGKSLEISQEEGKKILEDSKILGRDYMLIARYMENEYIKKPKEKLAKLKEDFDKLKRKLALVQNENAKKAIIEKMKKIKVEFDKLELWVKYHKAYLIQKQAYYAKNNKRYKQARLFLKQIEKKYIEITATSFPRFEGEFYAKFKGNKLESLRNQYIKN